MTHFASLEMREAERCSHEGRFGTRREASKCICGGGSAPDPVEGAYRPPSWIWGRRTGKREWKGLGMEREGKGREKKGRGGEGRRGERGIEFRCEWGGEWEGGMEG